MPEEPVEAAPDVGRVLGRAELEGEALLGGHQQGPDEVQPHGDGQPFKAGHEPHEVERHPGEREGGGDDVASRIEVGLEPAHRYW